MKIDIKSKSKSKSYKFYNTYNSYQIMDDVEEDFDTRSITDCTTTERYVMSDNEFKVLKDNIDRISDVVSPHITLESVSKYIYELVLTGKLIDIMGIIRILNIPSNYVNYRTYLQNDINMLNRLLRNSEVRFDHQRSLVIRFISEFNGRANRGNTYDRIQSLRKSDLKVILPLAFEVIHKVKYEDAKIDDNGDKLSLSHIDDKLFKSMERELLDELGEI